MSYQVLARKWRPQTFDQVVGQRAVTQTLRNAIKQGRVAHAFVFAGPRGIGKTTTARILSRALNCTQGPTPNPCGVCDACREIAEGRDLDVQEIDAATHTGIDTIRDVIVSNLAITPARDRFKIFIVDEAHQLSAQSFNALLKSIEEPPPHVIFILATTEFGKIPETILSRTQVFEFRTIPSRAIAERLRHVATEEGVSIADEALALIARWAEGSMRDGLTALDQIVSFAGSTVSLGDVETILGLVGRDLLFDVLSAVADENGPAAFDLTGRAVEAGYDLRIVCRELSRLVRDLLVLKIDPTRVDDPEIAPESERDRLVSLAKRFSREDLLRAFDVIAEAEADVKDSSQPRYHLEIALLRWIHLRKLVPLVELIQSLESAGSGGPRTDTLPQSPQRSHSSSRVAEGEDVESRRTDRAKTQTANGPAPSRGILEEPVATPPLDPAARALKEALLAEIRRIKMPFYGMVMAQAERMEVEPDRITVTFSSSQRALREQFEQNRGWLESVAQRVAGRSITIRSADVAAPPAPAVGVVKGDLRQQAMSDPAVQSLLEVFPAEIRGIEEIP